MVIECFLFVYSNLGSITDRLSHMAYVDKMLLLHFVSQDALAYKAKHVDKMQSKIAQFQDQGFSRLPVLMRMNYGGKFQVELISGDAFVCNLRSLTNGEAREARREAIKFMSDLEGMSSLYALASQINPIPSLFCSQFLVYKSIESA